MAEFEPGTGHYPVKGAVPGQRLTHRGRGKSEIRFSVVFELKQNFL
jgi:hypothetical protein